MTEQQQNILSLFNTKDPVNMEIAEETAISTGNGVWFSNWIDDKLKEEGVQQYFRWILSGAPLDYKPDKDYRIFRTFRITQRMDDHAQLEIQIIAAQMLELVKNIEGNPFEHTLKAWGY